MNPTVNLLEGELERLYTSPSWSKLCGVLLGFDRQTRGWSRAARRRSFVAWCAAARPSVDPWH